MNIDRIILNNLVCNESFARKTLPFVKLEYFQDKLDRTLFNIINTFVDTYNSSPPIEALKIEIGNLENITEDQHTELVKIVSSFKSDVAVQQEWLIDQTEKFCKEKALYNAVLASIKIMDDKTEQVSRGMIPKLLQDALGVSFDVHVGHDFIEDAESRFDFYNKKEERIQFDIDYLNEITGGGLPRKTLNILMSGTGVGKSLAMCHMASYNLMRGKNVLYITLEMAEERIAERIDANLLNVSLDDLKTISKEKYNSRMAAVKARCKGKLIIKEYPTASASASNFRYLINELRLKRNFVPDIIYIDYINICASSRLKSASNVNSYTYVKAIAEELRGLGVEFNVPIVSATQLNRTGFSNSDAGMEDTAESFGLPATADFMIAMITTEELEELSQIMFKQLKNRYGDPGKNKRFVVGIDKDKMRLYNVEETAQDVLDGPVMDHGAFGDRAKAEKFDKRKFEGFN